jgi:ERCC4-type nuclease
MKETEFDTRPYTLLIDTREQAAWDFKGMQADMKDGGGTIILKTKRAGLKTGDYSIEGLEDQVAIERKSLEDFFHCVGSDRSRFENQLERLNALPCGRMVIEADWERMLRGCPNSKLKPKTVVRSVISWQMDAFPNVHWWFMPGKRLAEVVAFRILDRYWRVNRKNE